MVSLAVQPGLTRNANVKKEATTELLPKVKAFSDTYVNDEVLAKQILAHAIEVYYFLQLANKEGKNNRSRCA